MGQPPEPRSGGRLIVECLRAQGATTAFCVPGESYLEVLDAAIDRLRLVVCRHEGGAAFMAEAWGKLTGTPGIAMVTRGPGACNAAIGVHTAMQDSTPMILLVGQVARDQRDREAFQEIDYRRMYGPVAKWVAEIDRADRVPEYIARAWSTALSGRPGPVVLALPEDMLREAAAVAPAPRAPVPVPCPDPAAVATAADLLARAERPLVIVGGSRWTDADCDLLRQVAERWDLPVVCSFRRQDLMHADSPALAGDLGTGPNPDLVARVRRADLILAIGTRLGEIATQGYSLFTPPDIGIPLIHVHADAVELGKVYRPDLAIQAAPGAFLAALGRTGRPAAPPARAGWRTDLRRVLEVWRTPPASDADLDLGAVMVWLRDRLPPDAVVTNDAGNFSGWGHRYLRHGRPGRQLGPTSGAMGYAIPAAVAAGIADPGRVVVAFVGDGGFQMTGQELATAVQAGAAPVILVFNNGMYGTIRMHQESRFPGRVSATDLVNPDFAALARAYGAVGATVTRTSDFAPAFDAALRSGKPAVIELRMDPEQITTRTTLSALRARAQAGS